MTFTIGRGNDIVCAAIKEVAGRLVGKEIEPLFANMGKAWEYLVADPQLRWYVLRATKPVCLDHRHKRRIGPEKGVIHIATGAVDNALWDLYARSRNKPLWKLVVDMSPVRIYPSSTVGKTSQSCCTGGDRKLRRISLHHRRHYEGGGARTA